MVPHVQILLLPVLEAAAVLLLLILEAEAAAVLLLLILEAEAHLMTTVLPPTTTAVQKAVQKAVRQHRITLASRRLASIILIHQMIVLLFAIGTQTQKNASYQLCQQRMRQQVITMHQQQLQQRQLRQQQLQQRQLRHHQIHHHQIPHHQVLILKKNRQ